AGLGIEDPETKDRTLALTDKPQFEWEAFDEYWRKGHGPKIVYADGTEDRQTDLVAYYLQQHRIPGGPTSEHSPPYSANPDRAGRLIGDPAQHLRPYRRPAFDGLAQLGYHTKQDLESFFDSGPGKYSEKIVPDEKVFIRGFAFHLAEEHEVFQIGNRRRDPIVLLKWHVRNTDLSRPQFRGRWMAQHAALIRDLKTEVYGLRRYVQLVNVSTATDKLYDPIGDRYDGVSAFSFADVNGLEDFMSSTEYEKIRDDEAVFARETTFFTALNYVIRDLT
ncbi:MAG: EthD domain-containing protein, partial [Gammaproteobacteria bacterium]